MVRGLVLGIGLIAAVVGPAMAQVPATPYYAMDPTSPLAPRAAAPVQQQVLENYRSQLLQAQREGLQQNPSGVSRAQVDINSRLNGYALPAPAAAAPTAGLLPVPFPSATPGTSSTAPHP